MIALPPGCTVTYAVYVDVDYLTDEMVAWYELVGGTIYKINGTTIVDKNNQLSM